MPSRTKIKTQVSIAASLMLAISAVALFLNLGKIMVAVSLVAAPKMTVRMAVVPAGEVLTTWRSEMFPENWVPVDEQVLMGVNVFEDPRGTVDENCVTSASACYELTARCREELAQCPKISAGHPAYHPYRFLHDFSYAGYHRGEKLIPPEDPSPDAWTKNAPVIDVTKSPYNCAPDGKMDCRPAIQSAIDAVGPAGGIVYLPSGEYRITAKDAWYFLRILKSKLVLRGDGQNLTKIKVDPYFQGVFDMDNKTVIEIGSGKYADPAKGIIGAWRPLDPAKVAKITKDILFPTKVISLDNVSFFAAGDPVAINGDFTAGYIAEHDSVGIWQNNWTKYGYTAYKLRRTVMAVDPANKTITLDVPTRYRVKTYDNPTVYKTGDGYSEIGIEKMSFGMIRHPDEWFGDEDSAIHKQIEGNKLIELSDVRNGWLYDIGSYRPAENAARPTDNRQYGAYEVEILNGIIGMYYSQFVTLKKFSFKNMQVDGGGDSGGDGYALEIHANDILVENGTLQKVKKGFSYQWGIANGNVVKNVTFKEIFATQNDFHGALSTANLQDNNVLEGTHWEAAVRPIPTVKAGDPTRPDSVSGSQNVFWNTRGTPLTIPVRDWWDRDNDNDNIWDQNEGHGAWSDPGSIVSSQFGWGYVIGTFGEEARVVAARMPDRCQNDIDKNGDGQYDACSDFWEPNILPRDYLEGIGYDKSTEVKYAGKTLAPRSLYEAQLALRLEKNKNPVKFQRGDVDGNNKLSISDAISILLYLFQGTVTPTCLDSADTNDDGQLNITDAKYLLEYMFSGSTLAPAEPFELCGLDPTPLDNLGCASFPLCQQ